MYIDTPLHGTDLYVILLCLLTTDIPLTVRHIFEDNHNWGAFRIAEKDNLRDVEIKEVNKMLSCKDESRGFFTYICEYCGTLKTVYFGCNSRICSNCGKNHTDKWAKSLQKALFNVPHRHAVFTIPDALWHVVRNNRFLQEVFDGCGNRSDQRHDLLQAQKRKIDCRRYRCAASFFQESGIQSTHPYTCD